MPIVSVQNRYNATDRRSASMVDLCEQEQLTFLPWAPVQEADRNTAVAEAAQRHGVSERQVVLAWMLASSPSILPIPGTGSPAHAEENIAAAALELSPDEIAAISKGGEVMETTKSADGTVIAYDRAGQGPPLVVTLGAFCDRKTFVPPADLTARFTVYTYDRRGRGDSGDTRPYSPDREVADLAAVIEAAARVGGRGVRVRALLWRHAGAARRVGGPADRRAGGVRGAVHHPGDTGGTGESGGPITELVEAGRRGDAVRFWMTDVVRVPARMVAMMERTPMWAGLEALTHTLPYDLALTGDRGVPTDDLARITVPVLVLGGANSPDWFHRTVRETMAAIPGARLVMLEGQDHGAPPEVLTPVLTEFFLR